MSKPLVSICCITYNHKLYIEKCLEGFIIQETDFNFEVLIFDDASTDGSQEIIKNFAKKHDNFHLYLQDVNQWDLKKYGLIDYLFPAAKGKYIAICEGDDYWTDPYKLQKQVDFLEANSDFVLSFHNAEVLNIVSKEKYFFVDSYASEEYTSKDIFENWLIPTASMVFRNVLDKNLPDFFIKATHGDLGLQVYLNEYGKFQAINEVMSVYRINESSVTINSFSSLKHNNAHIEQLKLMNVFFDKRYDLYIKRRMFLYYLRNANVYRKESVTIPFYWILKAIILKPSLIFYYKKQFINSLKTVFYTFRVFLNLKKE